MAQGGIWRYRKPITGSINRSKIVARGITNSNAVTWLILVILIMGPPGLQQGYQKQPCIWARVLHKAGRERRSRNGEHGTLSYLTGMTLMTSFGLNRE